VFWSTFQSLENLEMKKTLVALAALAATSAFAQSSVEIYGIVDVGYTKHDIENGTGGANTAAQNAAATTKRTVIGSNGLSTSRLGFRGTEDLGNGNKAGFTFETGLAPAGNANGAASTAANGAHTLSAIDNRQAFVSLENKDLGSLKIGRQYSVAHTIQAAYNAGGSNNVVGDVAYTQAEVGATGPTNGISGLRADVTGGGAAYILRSANAVSYTLPTLVPGLTLAAAAVKANTDNNGTSAGTKATAYLAKYDKGPMSLGFASITGTLQATTAADVATGLAAQGAFQARDVKLKNTVLGASYDLGMAKAYYTIVTLKADQELAQALKRKANKIGVSMPAGRFTPFVQYGTAKVTDGIGGAVGTDVNSTYKVKGTQVGTTYDLSKRTTAYAIYGKNSGTVDAVAGTAGLGQTFREKQYAVGVRHSF
jgi:predicted porin